MIIKPKVRGFICTTAHPAGCFENVKREAGFAAEKIKGNMPLNGHRPSGALVIGSSAGYGLSSRIAAAFGYNAATVGVFFERPGSDGKTASAGWYNNAAFEKLASEKGIPYESINADAFSNEAKEKAIEAIKRVMPSGKVDLVIYSLGAPRRTDPVTGQVWHSAIKPVGQVFKGKTVDFHTGNVYEAEIPPASQDEVDGAVKVMGGEDWVLWMEALQNAGVLADSACTVAYSYIGPELTHAVYKDGTIGMAKADVERAGCDITAMLKDKGGKAFVSVNKALVTQSSSAIPVVPLYVSILYKLMKEQGTHEGCIEQIVRLYSERLYTGGGLEAVPVDSEGRIRMDDLEMKPALQSDIQVIWDKVDSDNIDELTDLQGYRSDFYSLFGFGVNGVDYEADIEI